MSQAKLTPAIVAAAIAGFEQQKKEIDEQIAELRQMLKGGSEPAVIGSEAVKPRKRRSAAVRRRMALAQRARYAKLKQDSETTQATTAKPKRKMSAAGRRNIIEGIKRRWAVKRAEAEKLASAKTEAGPRRKLSAAARRKMAEGSKKRWAAKKAAA